jgi:predicted HD phosphohydrolase
METVEFTRMSDGTQADYDLLKSYGSAFTAELPDRILKALAELDHGTTGYQVTRYEHSLQTASRAQRAGKDEEYVVMALVHDIGDGLAPYSHSEMIGAVLRGFVRPEVRWIAMHHGVFQLYYYGQYTGSDPNARERYRGHQWFDACVEFCENFDEVSFDPAYDTLPLDIFEPMVRRVFAEPRYDPAAAEEL